MSSSVAAASPGSCCLVCEQHDWAVHWFYRCNVRCRFSHPRFTVSNCQLIVVAGSIGCILMEHITVLREVCSHRGGPRGSTEKCGVGSFSNFTARSHQAHKSLRSRFSLGCKSTHTRVTLHNIGTGRRISAATTRIVCVYIYIYTFILIYLYTHTLTHTHTIAVDCCTNTVYS